jgi:RNA polymerase sigma factor (sigma-70 family)
LEVQDMNFETFVKKISPKLKAIAKRLDGRYSFFNDEDLYQQALLYLWERWQEGQLSDSTESYILQGCALFLRNYIRKVYKKIDCNCVSLYGFEEEDDRTGTEVSLPSYDISDSLEFEILWDQILKSLTQREKEVLELCMEGLTIREIGQRLGISHVMVLKIKNRIKRKCAWIKDV